jgi:molecular chaperone DnaK
VERALDDKNRQIDKTEKKRIKEEINALRKMVYKNKPGSMEAGDVAAIRSAMERVKASAERIV